MSTSQNIPQLMMRWTAGKFAQSEFRFNFGIGYARQVRPRDPQNGCGSRVRTCFCWSDRSTLSSTRIRARQTLSRMEIERDRVNTVSLGRRLTALCLLYERRGPNGKLRNCREESTDQVFNAFISLMSELATSDNGD